MLWNIYSELTPIKLKNCVIIIFINKLESNLLSKFEIKVSGEENIF